MNGPTLGFLAAAAGILALGVTVDTVDRRRDRREREREERAARRRLLDEIDRHHR